MRDLIYRDDVIKELEEIGNLYEDEEITGLAKNRINALIPATPDTRLYSDGFADGYKQGQKDRKLDEWCTDCKEYDKERHNCPRYNRVIREALEEVKNG